MEFATGKLYSVAPILEKLAKQDVPIKVSFRLNKFLKVVAQEVQALEEARVSLVKKYGVEDEKSGDIKVGPENMSKFQDEFKELLGEVVSVPLTKIPIEWVEEASLSSYEVQQIDFLFDTGEDDEDEDKGDE